MTYRLSHLAVALLAPLALSACIIVDGDAEPVRKVTVERFAERQAVVTLRIRILSRIRRVNAINLSGLKDRIDA